LKGQIEYKNYILLFVLFYIKGVLKMKKTVSLLLLFAVLLTLFCACKKNDETQPTSSPEPTTWGLILDELPDIGKYKSADSNV